MLRKKRYFVLYPEYFDKKLTRNQGRKVPKNKAVDDCSLAKLVFACKHLNYDYVVEKEKKYSKNWWNSEGRILINPESVKNKSVLINDVANIARKLKKKAQQSGKTKKKK